MTEVLKVLTDYKEEILLALSILLTIISIFVKRKPKTLDDFRFSVMEVLSLIPDMVSKVERPGHGEEKRLEVQNSCISLISHSLQRALTDSEIQFVKKEVNTQVEKVLSSPSKKVC